MAPVRASGAASCRRGIGIKSSRHGCSALRPLLPSSLASTSIINISDRNFPGAAALPEQWNKYDKTAARTHGKPGREVRPKSATIDIHAHVDVPEAAKFVEPYLDWSTIPLAHFADAATKALNQKQAADISARRDHDHRMADLDAMAIDIQVIAPPPLQCYYSVPLDIAVKAAQIVNDGVAEFCGKYPDRLKGFGSVPMPDGQEAAKELERCVRKLGFTGVEILTNVNGKELSDPAFAPFWQKAEELGALVMI